MKKSKIDGVLATEKRAWLAWKKGRPPTTAKYSMLTHDIYNYFGNFEKKYISTQNAALRSSLLRDVPRCLLTFEPPPHLRSYIDISHLDHSSVSSSTDSRQRTSSAHSQTLTTIVISRDFEIYKLACRCCVYPVFGKHISIGKGTEKSKSRKLAPKRLMEDKNHLLEYLPKIFNLSPENHSQYQSFLNSKEFGVQLRMKPSQKEVLQKELMSKLCHLENDNNCYYSEHAFINTKSFKTWKSRERLVLGELLGEADVNLMMNKFENRDCFQDFLYLAKKVFLYELEEAIKNDVADTSQNVFSPTSDRLLREFTARYRLTNVSAAVGSIKAILSICYEDLHYWEFDDVIMKMLTMFELLKACIARHDPILVSELEDIAYSCDLVCNHLEKHMTSCFTEKFHRPIKVLKLRLKLAEICCNINADIHGKANDEWSEVVTKWLRNAVVDLYISWTQLEKDLTIASILETATDVVCIVKHLETSPNVMQAIFSEYVTNVKTTVCEVIYQCLMDDIQVLCNKQAWIQVEDESNFAAEFALVNKLSELDELVFIKYDMKPDVNKLYSWRVTFHPLAMRWLDILSTTLSDMTLESISIDRYDIFPQCRSHHSDAVSDSSDSPRERNSSADSVIENVIHLSTKVCLNDQKHSFEETSFTVPRGIQSESMLVQKGEDVCSTISDSSQSFIRKTTSQFNLVPNQIPEEKASLLPVDETLSSSTEDRSSSGHGTVVSSTSEILQHSDGDGSDVCSSDDSLIFATARTTPESYHSAVSELSSVPWSDEESCEEEVELVDAEVSNSQFCEVSSSGSINALEAMNLYNDMDIIFATASTSVVDFITILSRTSDLTDRIASTIYLQEFGVCINENRIIKELFQRFQQKVQELFANLIRLFCINMTNAELYKDCTTPRMNLLQTSLRQQINAGHRNGSIKMHSQKSADKQCVLTAVKRLNNLCLICDEVPKLFKTKKLQRNLLPEEDGCVTQHSSQDNDFISTCIYTNVNYFVESSINGLLNLLAYDQSTGITLYFDVWHSKFRAGKSVSMTIATKVRERINDLLLSLRIWLAETEPKRNSELLRKIWSYFSNWFETTVSGIVNQLLTIQFSVLKFSRELMYIFSQMLKEWSEHEFAMNCLLVDEMVKSIQHSVTTLEFFCSPTSFLISLFEKYEDPLYMSFLQNLNFDRAEEESISFYDNLQVLSNLCLFKMKHRKSFTGKKLLSVVMELLCKPEDSSSHAGEVKAEAMGLCNQLLCKGHIRFMSKTVKYENMPDLVEVCLSQEDTSSTATAFNAKVKSRSSSECTSDPDACRSFKTSSFSETSDNEVTSFQSRANYFYTFQSSVCLNDNDILENVMAKSILSKWTVCNLLHNRSKFDKTAEEYLLDKGKLSRQACSTFCQILCN